VRVWTRRDDEALHVSGHACRDEQRKMIELTKPRGFIPVHGSFVHLARHAALARELGVPETLVVENGTLVEIDALSMRSVSQLEVGRVHIQHGGEITSDVLRARAHIAESGVVLVVLDFDRAGRLMQTPEVVARGVVDDLDLSELGLLEDVQLSVARSVNALEVAADIATIELTATRAARRVFRDALGWRPVVHTVVRRASP
jgi:ribonuclease J